MGYHDDPVGYEQRLRAKLRPENIRATLAFAGLYQMTYEMLIHAVVDRVREFYTLSIGDDSPTADEEDEYQRRVRSLAKSSVEASLLWLVRSGAITEAQTQRLDAFYAHRHELAHEIAKYIVDADADPDVGLLFEAIEVLKDFHRFWVDVELSTGGFIAADGSVFEDVDADDVVPMPLALLQHCLDAYVEGLTPQHDGTGPRGDSAAEAAAGAEGTAGP